MYKSPIEIIYGDTQIKMEGDILKAVQSYGIKVDKEELIRVLNNDRNQYDDGHKAGYREGYNEAMDSIVHCKDCKHCMLWREPSEKAIGYCRFRYMYSDYPKFHIVKADDFCSYGERKEEWEDGDEIDLE